MGNEETEIGNGLETKPRVHNTLQRVSNANYLCTNTLGKVTWLAREIYYALWRKQAVRIHIVVTIDRAINRSSIRRRLSASSKGHGESAAGQDEILPEERVPLQLSNTDKSVICAGSLARAPKEFFSILLSLF